MDLFGNIAWESTRLKAHHKAETMRQQGFVGPFTLSIQELEYGAFRDSLAELEARSQVEG